MPVFNPTYLKVVETYLKFRDIEVEVIDMKRRCVRPGGGLKQKIDNTIAGYLFQNPNFFGSVSGLHGYL